MLKKTILWILISLALSGAYFALEWFYIIPKGHVDGTPISTEETRWTILLMSIGISFIVGFFIFKKPNDYGHGADNSDYFDHTGGAGGIM